MTSGTNWRIPNTDRWILALVWLGLTGTVWAEPSMALESLMRQLAAVTQVEAGYREVVESQLLQQPISTSGHLLYRAPDRLDKTSDRGDSIRIEGETLTLVQGREQTRIAIADQPALQTLISALRATFAGDLDRLRTDYLLALQPHAEGWVLDLTPRERRFLTLFEHIRIQGQGDRIDSLEVQEGNGDRRTLYLSDQRILTGESAGQTR